MTASSRTRHEDEALGAEKTLDDPALPSQSAPMTEASRNVGRMTIELIDAGSGMPVPHITFDPVGRFTPAMMEQYVPYFAQAINRAQADIRAKQRS